MAYCDYSYKFRALRRAWGGQCVWWPCGRRSGLQFAHIRPTRLVGRSRGQKKRYLDIVRNPECYVLLCRDHHALLDGFRSRVSAPAPYVGDGVPF